MSIPTQMSLSGFIATEPQVTHTANGTARFYARIGVEHARRETDGTFTPIEPSFHDLVIFGASAERANARFRRGDNFVASGYIHEYEVERNGNPVPREEFVARRIGHDTARTRYNVERSARRTTEPAALESPATDRSDIDHAVGL